MLALALQCYLMVESEPQASNASRVEQQKKVSVSAPLKIRVGVSEPSRGLVEVEAPSDIQVQVRAAQGKRVIYRTRKNAK